ncbi:MAG TPA: hypothetical protein VFZ58_04280 [Candidatus Saccharimonadales bacterium]
MAKWPLFAVLLLVLSVVVGCSSPAPAPARTPEQLFEQELESKGFGFKDVEVEREIEDGLETLEAVTNVRGCDVELEMVLGKLVFRVGEIHLTDRQAEKLKGKDKNSEPDWPAGNGLNNPTLPQVEKMLKSPPREIRAAVELCRK